MMNDDTKELNTVENQDETRPLTMPDNVEKTTPLHVADDTNAAQTEVLPTAADGGEETIPLEAVADKPIPSANDVPLYVTGNDSPQAEQSASGEPYPSPQSAGVQTQSSTASDSAAKRDVSTLTVVFGLMGVLIGALGLVFGVTFPDLLISRFTADPQVLVAIICAVVGVVLVAIAIVWAVMGTVKKKS